MFDYFRDCLSNAHQVSLKVYIIFCQSDDLALHSRSQLRLNLDKSLTCTIANQYLRHYSSYGIPTSHDDRLIHGICAHARFDDLDLDAMSQGVGKGKN